MLTFRQPEAVREVFRVCPRLERGSAKGFRFLEVRLLLLSLSLSFFLFFSLECVLASNTHSPRHSKIYELNGNSPSMSDKNRNQFFISPKKVQPSHLSPPALETDRTTLNDSSPLPPPPRL